MKSSPFITKTEANRYEEQNPQPTAQNDYWMPYEHRANKCAYTHTIQRYRHKHIPEHIHTQSHTIARRETVRIELDYGIGTYSLAVFSGHSMLALPHSLTTFCTSEKTTKWSWLNNCNNYCHYNKKSKSSAAAAAAIAARAEGSRANCNVPNDCGVASLPTPLQRSWRRCD